MTTIEVVDTALKIGLGAIITAIAGIVALNKTQSHEIEKQRWRRIQDALEEISREFEGIHRKLVKRATTDFTVKKMVQPEHTITIRQFGDPEGQMDVALRETKECILKLHELEGKLLLIAGAKEEGLLQDYRSKATEIEDVSINQPGAPEELKPVIDDLIAKRSAFYAAISSLYKKP